MGLRERKKQRTRTALIDAALDLFLRQGYEATTIEQIAERVEVSSRTFFRYFGSKEEVALAPAADGQELLLTELVARPDTEPPFTALSQAARSCLDALRRLDAAEAERYLRVQELIRETPVLLAAHLRMLLEYGKKMTAEVARRQGRDPHEPLPQFVVSVFTGLTTICLGGPPPDLPALARRLEELLQLAEQSLRPGWDR